MADSSLMDLSMHGLIEQVLPFRTPKYVEDFCEKLLGEGIASPSDLVKASKKALETKLSTHASFNFIEMADALSLRGAMDPSQEERPPPRPALTNGGNSGRRGRSRSREKQRGGKREFSGGRGRGQQRRGQQRGRNNNKSPPPELWSACERGDVAVVDRLLKEGADPEEKHEGWTPLMKASEEGHVQVMTLLLDKKVDIMAANRKGRTALSFAASPSFNSKLNVERDTPVEAIRLLLERGADHKHKDDRGLTAKEFAAKQKGREDALSVFEDFNC